MSTSIHDVRRLRERVRELEQRLEVQTKVFREQSAMYNALVARFRQSKADFKALVERLPDAVFVHRKGIIRYANSAMQRLLGYSADQLIGKDASALFVHAEDCAKLREYQAGLEARETVEPLRLRWVKRDGGVVVIEGVRAPLECDDESALTIARDVTESLYFDEQRVAAEEARLVCEERYRVVFDASPLPILLFDPTSLRFVAVNRAATNVYGYRMDELLGMSISDLKVEDEIAELMDGMVGASAGDLPTATTWHATRRHRRKDGSVLQMEITAHPVMFEGKPTILAIALDQTEKRRLEEHVRQAQKMEAIGALAGGIAHDFNNLLSVILGYTNVAIDTASTGDPIRDDLAEVLRAGERASAMTRQLLAFGRRQILQPRTVDLNEVVGRMERMLERLVGEQVRIVLAAAADCGDVFGDPGQIEQVIMNLVVNARDAMPGGGSATIETKNVFFPSACAAEGGEMAPGSYVMVAVTDTGTGMDAATRAHIFEPFFTTKEKGKGTGLGLSTVFGIVRQSGGHVRVESELGKGSTFEIYFPCHSRGEATEDAAAPAQPPTLRGCEKILLVEDEDGVRAVARTILRRQGYEVIEAANGGEAFLLAEKHAAEIDLVLTDVIMPRMSADELVERLAPILPGVGIVYMSGYAEQAVFQRLALGPRAAFVQKPLAPDMLCMKVREVLDAPPQSSWRKRSP